MANTAAGGVKKTSSKASTAYNSSVDPSSGSGAVSASTKTSNTGGQGRVSASVDPTAYISDFLSRYGGKSAENTGTAASTGTASTKKTSSSKESDATTDVYDWKTFDGNASTDPAGYIKYFGARYAGLTPAAEAAEAADAAAAETGAGATAAGKTAVTADEAAGEDAVVTDAVTGPASTAEETEKADTSDQPVYLYQIFMDLVNRIKGNSDKVEGASSSPADEPVVAQQKAEPAEDGKYLGYATDDLSTAAIMGENTKAANNMDTSPAGIYESLQEKKYNGGEGTVITGYTEEESKQNIRNRYGVDPDGTEEEVRAQIAEKNLSDNQAGYIYGLIKGFHPDWGAW